MKYLGIDYGTKRVGLATSDDEGRFAFPYTIIQNSIHIYTDIEKVIERENIGVIILGNSIASNETLNIVTQNITQFAEGLSHRMSIPIHLEREDFSSVEAHRYQTKAGSRDDSAAAIILQRFLDKQKK